VRGLLKRIAASITMGFVVTIAVTGLYAISENLSYRGVGYDRLVEASPQTNAFKYGETIRFGFPFSWVRTTIYFPLYPTCLHCPLSYRVTDIVPNSVGTAKIDWLSFGFDLSLYAIGSYPLTFLSSGLAPRFRAESQRRIPKLKNRVVMCASGLCLGWLAFYLLAVETVNSLGLVPLAGNYRTLLGSPSGLPGLEAFLLLLFSLVGVASGIRSTWISATGGAVLAFSSAFVIFFPGLLVSMFFLNPEFAMLYVLWTSIMVAGGVSSLRKGLLHTVHWA
jgi:hypothetical protein